MHEARLDLARSAACLRRCWMNCGRVATRVRSFCVTMHWPQSRPNAASIAASAGR